MMRITAAENACADGRECAIEWPGLKAKSQESLLEWRERCRGNIVRGFESGTGCVLCPAGATREEFLRLLAEWDRGFEGAGVATHRARAAKLNHLAERAQMISAQMHSAIQILDPDHQQEAILDCSSLADDFARDLDALAGALS